MEPEEFQEFYASNELCRGLPGILKYKRESETTTSSSQDGTQSQSSGSSPVCCQFCGASAWPPLDPLYEEKNEEFCCEGHRELFDMVMQERRGALRRSAEWPSGSAAPDYLFSSDKEQKDKARKSFKQQQKEMEEYYKQMNEVAPLKGVISFRLSNCVPSSDVCRVRERFPSDEASGQASCAQACTLEFGLTQQECSSGITEKFYSNGKKFLTVFPDGSAQVFFPSGNLAIIILSTMGEKTCIVQDDIAVSSHPIRALFQSSGKATCYHKKGSIWLGMDALGGQILSQNGRKMRTWFWTDRDQVPIPTKPLFLSFNRNIDVRVLGQRSVFVCFQALEHRARFRVGTCVPRVEVRTARVLASKEDLVLLACRVGLHMALIQLQQCQNFPSSPTAQRARPPPFLYSLARRLRCLVPQVPMDEVDEAFIQRCLHACDRP